MAWTDYRIGLLPIGAYARLMRLDKPIGAFLLMWPCWWGVTMASYLPPFPVLLLFTIGAFTMRAAGCIVNDWWDRDLDREVTRTASRPLASGEISTREAFALLLFLLAISAAVALSLGWLVLKLSLIWLVMVVIYPLMKRITWWPQLFLGLTFNAGALLGWVAVRGQIDPPAIILYLGAVFWTLSYDTIYAHQDIEDDARIGIKSTARLFGRHSLLFIGIGYGVFLICLMFIGFLMKFHPVYFLLITLVCAQLFLQVTKVDLNNPESCLDAFRSNQWTGALIWLALAFSIA